MIKKNLIKKLLIVFMILCFFAVTSKKANAYSYLADKAEIPIELEVSGANSICQTDDGYIWIGQYSGLIRYDSKEFVTYKEFVEGDNTYKLDNIKQVISFNDIMFASNSKSLIKYVNNEFHNIPLEENDVLINEMSLDKSNGLIYLATTKGIYKYKINSNTIEKTNIQSDVIDVTYCNNGYYYQTPEGIFDSTDNMLISDKYILDIETSDEKIYVANTSGLIKIIDCKSNQVLEKVYNLGNQINKVLPNSDNTLLFCACEQGLKIVDINTDVITSATNLVNNQRLVSLMIDYENNLWIVSYSTGVSMITNNAITDILFDTEQSILDDYGRYCYSVDKVGDILYLASYGEVVMFDTVNQKVIKNKEYNGKKYNQIMYKINEYLDNLSEEDKSSILSNLYFRDVEEFNGKLYIAAFGLGLIEYNLSNEEVKIYDKAYLDDKTSASSFSQTHNIRCIKAYNGFLLFSTTRDILKFDGTNFSIFTINPDNTKEYPLFLGKDNNENIVMVINKRGLFTINSDLSNYRALGDDPNPQDSGMLKFLYDDDNTIYYNINSELFSLVKNSDGSYTKHEITVPKVKGSIVELNKVKLTDANGNISYQYVIASQNQIYIAESIKNGFENYIMFDSTNGLKKGIDPNTSGYYDEEKQLYYFQSQAGVFVYDFNYGQESRVPIKININSIKIDSDIFYGNELKLSKNTERITFNLSVLSFKPTKGYKVYYKLDGVDKDYHLSEDGTTNFTYTNLKGGKYKFHVYVIDEQGQKSNQIDISLNKTKKIYEHAAFIILVILLGLAIVVGTLVYYFRRKIKQSIKRQLEYKKITLESIEAIARTIDAKDVYTNGHSRRVGYYSREIAKAMNLPEKQVENIFYTALLHDIGKIGIPLSIINKPARLDDEEYAIMKTHTTKGGKILKDISTIPGIVEGAMYHHERYDGTGYPTGLKGTNIPLNARIICCADCFDAMATKRSYKEPCSKEYIISEFERCSGTQFDPDIAKVVIELIKADKFKTIIEENNEMKNDIITIEESKKD